ncbi:MAG TPA: cohesin domain-containing protein [Dehalococcoidia bacterium]
MRAIASSVGAALAIVIVGCGGATREDSPPPAGLEFTEFTDARPAQPDSSLIWLPHGGLPAIIELVEGIVVVEVAEIVDVTVPKEPAPPGWPAEELDGDPLTTYDVLVEQWIKGDGGTELRIVGPGGITEDGPDFEGGAFPLEPGRRYTLALVPMRPSLPVTADYLWDWGGFASFEVTDGFVHVLNHELTGDLEEKYGGMPEDEFVAILKNIVANPPKITPLPTLSPTPDHIDSVEGDPSLVIERMAIDVGAADIAANTATSLGALQRCGAFGVGDTLTVDVTVDAVPEVSDSKGGVRGFQFRLHYDPDVLRVIKADYEMLLAASDGSYLVSLGDDPPDEDGILVAGVADFGQEIAPESGPGVLGRVTFEALGAGVSPLTLTRVAVLDGSQNALTIKEVSRASVAVAAACPAGP